MFSLGDLNYPLPWIIHSYMLSVRVWLLYDIILLHKLLFFWLLLSDLKRCFCRVYEETGLKGLWRVTGLMVADSSGKDTRLRCQRCDVTVIDFNHDGHPTEHTGWTETKRRDRKATTQRNTPAYTV